MEVMVAQFLKLYFGTHFDSHCVLSLHHLLEQMQDQVSRLFEYMGKFNNNNNYNNNIWTNLVRNESVHKICMFNHIS